MKNTPLVSIITPVLNGARYLDQCIQSVLNQQYHHIEHVFIDGGSTDSTLDILGIYKEQYPQKIVIISDPGSTACSAINTGWKRAQGDIFGWLGADDLFTTNAILYAVNFFRNNPDAYFVHGGCDFVDENSNVFRKIGDRDFTVSELVNDDCYVAIMSSFYRREVVDRVGYMNTNISAKELDILSKLLIGKPCIKEGILLPKLNSCDIDYWIRVGKTFKMHRIDHTLSQFRYNSGSITATKGGLIYPAEQFLISRKHGGNIFSHYARRYYKYLARQFSGPLYPVVRKLYRLTIKRLINSYE